MTRHSRTSCWVGVPEKWSTVQRFWSEANDFSYTSPLFFFSKAKKRIDDRNKMVQANRSMQNIWVAASDGDLERVKVRLWPFAVRTLLSLSTWSKWKVSPQSAAADHS